MEHDFQIRGAGKEAAAHEVKENTGTEVGGKACCAGFLNPAKVDRSSAPPQQGINAESRCLLQLHISKSRAHFWAP